MEPPAGEDRRVFDSEKADYLVERRMKHNSKPTVLEVNNTLEGLLSHLIVDIPLTNTTGDLPSIFFLICPHFLDYANMPYIMTLIPKSCNSYLRHQRVANESSRHQ